MFEGTPVGAPKGGGERVRNSGTQEWHNPGKSIITLPRVVQCAVSQINQNEQVQKFHVYDEQLSQHRVGR